MCSSSRAQPAIEAFLADLERANRLREPVKLVSSSYLVDDVAALESSTQTNVLGLGKLIASQLVIAHTEWGVVIDHRNPELPPTALVGLDGVILKQDGHFKLSPDGREAVFTAARAPGTAGSFAYLVYPALVPAKMRAFSLAHGDVRLNIGSTAVLESESARITYEFDPKEYSLLGYSTDADGIVLKNRVLLFQTSQVLERAKLPFLIMTQSTRGGKTILTSARVYQLRPVGHLEESVFESHTYTGTVASDGLANSKHRLADPGSKVRIGTGARADAAPLVAPQRENKPKKVGNAVDLATVEANKRDPAVPILPQRKWFDRTLMTIGLVCLLGAFAWALRQRFSSSGRAA